MMNDTNQAILLLYAVLVGEIVCTILLSCLLWRNDTLNKSIECTKDLSLAAIAMAASKEMGPGVGPAILRNLHRTEEPTVTVVEKPETGVSFRQGSR